MARVSFVELISCALENYFLLCDIITAMEVPRRRGGSKGDRRVVVRRGAASKRRLFTAQCVRGCDARLVVFGDRVLPRVLSEIPSANRYENLPARGQSRPRAPTAAPASSACPCRLVARRRDLLAQEAPEEAALGEPVILKRRRPAPPAENRSVERGFVAVFQGRTRAAGRPVTLFPARSSDRAFSATTRAAEPRDHAGSSECAGRRSSRGAQASAPP